MRAIIFVVIVAALAIIAAVASGFLHVNQTRSAKAPQVSTTGNGVTAKGGQAPSFEVETGSVQVGTRNATVKVPDIKVVPPANQSAAAPANQS